MLVKKTITREEFYKKYDKANNLKRWMLSIEDFLYDSDETVWQDLYDELITSNRTSGKDWDSNINKAFSRREYAEREKFKNEYDEIYNGEEVSPGTEGYRRAVFDTEAILPKEFLNKVYSKFLIYLKGEKRGRRSILAEKNIPIEKVIAAYKTFKTTRKTAEVLGLSHPTVSKILKSYNIKVLPPGGSFAKGVRFASIVKWSMENPETPLPRDIDKIAALSNSTHDAVSQYLYRRKKKFIKEVIDKLPDLATLGLGFKRRGMVIPSSDFESYIIKVDRYDLSLTIEANTIYGEKFIFKNVNIKNILSKLPVLGVDGSSS